MLIYIFDIFFESLIQIKEIASNKESSKLSYDSVKFDVSVIIINVSEAHSINLFIYSVYKFVINLILIVSHSFKEAALTI